MKRVLVMLAMVSGILSLTALITIQEKNLKQDSTEKKNCTGYEVIESGLGINCHGDTIRLTKKHGYFEIASATEAMSSK